MIQVNAVCAECFGDEDIKQYIIDADGDPGCAFCGEEDSPTIDLDELAEFMHERLSLFYSRAIDWFMYISREGGYQGTTLETDEVLFDLEQVDLPRLQGSELRDALAYAVEHDEPWCDYDPAVLDENESMLMDWEQFCGLVKHERRFFFHAGGRDRSEHDESLSPVALFVQIARFIEELGLAVTREPGYTLYRARPRTAGERFERPGQLGPPPPERALQSNRMNPPGVPMFYGAETPQLAIAEVSSDSLSLGTFITEREVRLIDLANLPATPGTFSKASRDEIMALRFLHEFRRLITLPVDRDDRTVLDYIPTQVFTEFLRDHQFEAGMLDGLRYPSVLAGPNPVPPIGMFAGAGNANVVLFATEADIVDGNHATEESERPPWLRLTDVSQIPEDR